MRALPIFDPFADFDRLFDGMLTARPRQITGGNPVPLDVFEKEGQWVLRASLPGVKSENVDISIEENLLTIRGELGFEEEHSDAKVYRREIASGTFVRSIRLPKDVDVHNVQASFENGLVTVTLPRLVEEKPAAIKVPLKSLENTTAPTKVSKN